MNDQGKTLSFKEIPDEYLLMKDMIDNKNIKQLISQFKFIYFDQNDDNNSETFLFNFLTRFKFITYRIYHPNSNQEPEPEDIINSVICCEGHCLIIDSIKKDSLEKIIQKTKSFIINLKTADSLIKTEITSFHTYFQKQINSNSFLKLIFNPISAYIIRRNFLPSSYFNDKSFFTANKVHEKGKNILFDEYDSDKLLEEILKDKEALNTKNEVKDFQENEFIKLRNIFINNYAVFYLVIHLESFHIYAMKKIIVSEPKMISCEADFCRKYSHRCITPFYGFIKINKQINGFIYEYMSNGTLDYYLKRKEDINETFISMTITRIAQGIQYLHSNSLIHRDIKPDNILIDHNNIPYLSDFNYLKSIEPTTSDFTNGIGSSNYCSPEQFQGNEYSYPTDVYSFGLIIYFLCNKEDKFKNVPLDFIIDALKNVENEPTDKKYFSEAIQNLYKQCIKIKPEERLTINEIINILQNDVKSFYLIDPIFLTEHFDELQSDEIKHFFKEMYYLMIMTQDIKNIFPSLNSNDRFKLFCLFKIVKCHNISEIIYLIGQQYDNSQIIQTDYQKAKEYYELAVKMGILDAIFEIGKLYQFGFGVEQNYQKAREYYEISANNNNSFAQNNLGRFYEDGSGVEKDIKKAKEYYELSANQNNQFALNNLGNLYFFGKGVAKDITRAIECYEKSAHQNNSSALFNLGNIYLNGQDVEQNIPKAIECYKSSAKQNNDGALLKLSDLYLSGMFVEQDFNQAKEYLEIAAKSHNPNALFGLGLLYLNGLGVELNVSKAKEYFKLAEKQNDPQVFFNLGNIYYNGIGLKQDYEKAKEYFESAAKLDHSDAICGLGILYNCGQGVERDYSKAIAYFKRAAKYNNLNAICNLAEMYLEGEGVDVDIKESIKYLEYAAKNGSGGAHYNLGLIYRHGRGVTKDYLRAKKEFEEATKQNISSAFYQLGKLFFHGQGVKQDYAKAREYFIQAESDESFYQLGLMYKKGLGVEKDFKQALKYFEQAAYNKHQESIYQIGLLYFEGMIENTDYKKAIEYFEISSQKNNLNSLFYLGLMYEKGLGVERDVSKAIDYFEQCATNRFKENVSVSSTTNQIKKDIYLINNDTAYNDFYYQSNNILGLIYLIEKEFENHELAEKYIKEAGLNELPFGQNNFGLYSQFYLDKIGNAEHMFTRASKNKFALAEFNLAYICEKEGKTEESIEHFKKASEYENEPIIFRNTYYDDERLEISKSFIICYTNLKLSEYYSLQQQITFNNDMSEECILNAIFRPIFSLLFNMKTNSYVFNFQATKTKDGIIISNLKDFIMNNPLFHYRGKISSEASKQPQFGWRVVESKTQDNLEVVLILNPQQTEQNINMNNEQDDIYAEKEYFSKNKKIIIDHDEKMVNEDDRKDDILKIFNFFNKQSEFEVISENNEANDEEKFDTIKIQKKGSEVKLSLKYSKSLISRILYALNENRKIREEIIEQMKKLMYTEPYPILFGRIPIYSPNEQENTNQILQNIDDSFYEGFGNI